MLINTHSSHARQVHRPDGYFDVSQYISAKVGADLGYNFWFKVVKLAANRSVVRTNHQNIC
jgi:hypothetical protein